MRIAPFFAALVPFAAALSLSGCDYLRNLTESKTVTKAPLTIMALDAWDSRPLAGTACLEAARNLSFRTDAQGRANLAEAPTGNYTLTCTAESYHARTLEFEVGGKGAAVSIPFARMGLSAWYPEESKKRPRILKPDPIDTIRYPSKFDLPAFPGDSSGNFRFEWFFAENPGLNRGPGSIFATLPYYRMDVDPSDVSEGPDMITLKVRSRLAGEGGDTGYVVGIDSLPIVWIRNKPPRFKDLSPQAFSFKLGCEESDVFFRLRFEVLDPDGICDSVVFRTKDTSLALGRVHETRSCTDPNPLVLPLRNPFHGPTTFLLTAENTLDISVWDRNREHFDTSIQFTTYANVLPTITAGTVEDKTEFFASSRVSVSLEAKDTDGPVEKLEIDWGDGDVPTNIPLKIFPTDSLRDTVHHTYTKTGSYTITAYVIDRCHDTIGTRLWSPIRIRNNTDPSILIQPQPSLPSDTAYSIRLTIRDKDVEEYMDWYTSILIHWEDGQIYRDSSIIGETLPYLNRELSHVFAGPPPNGTAYEIRVEVKDSQGGTAQQSAILPVKAGP